MYDVNRCPSCQSSNIEKITPAFIHRFVVWRVTNRYAENHHPTYTVKCNNCSFICSGHRFTDQEEFNLYENYRGDIYNKQRLLVEPNYKVVMPRFVDTEYANLRKKVITDLVEKHVKPDKINTVLDFGGDDGSLIPNMFDCSKKYVYDISGVDTVPGINRFNSLEDKFKVDFLMCCQVLEHKSNLDAIMEEILSCVDSDSWVYLEVPTYEKLLVNDRIFHEHINAFNIQSISALLTRYNMDVYDEYIANGCLCLLSKLKK